MSLFRLATKITAEAPSTGRRPSTSAKVASFGTTMKRRSVALPAYRTRNMLACRDVGTSCPLSASLTV
jgi:hypothetical protein